MGRFVGCGAQLVGCSTKMAVCVKGIRDWQDGIYSSDNESLRCVGSL